MKQRPISAWSAVSAAAVRNSLVSQAIFTAAVPASSATRFLRRPSKRLELCLRRRRDKYSQGTRHLLLVLSLLSSTHCTEQLLTLDVSQHRYEGTWKPSVAGGSRQPREPTAGSWSNRGPKLPSQAPVDDKIPDSCYVGGAPHPLCINLPSPSLPVVCPRLSPRAFDHICSVSSLADLRTQCFLHSTILSIAGLGILQWSPSCLI